IAPKRSRVRSVSSAFLWLNVLLGVGGGQSCSPDKSPPTLANHCKLNSDCASNLTCSFGLCHVACKATKDCTQPATCVTTTGHLADAVCTMPDDAAQLQCVRNSDCKHLGSDLAALICGPDQQCRTPCATSADCIVPGQICAEGGVCASPSEVGPGTNRLKK